jgi:iron complex transport system ATP-binding protein
MIELKDVSLGYDHQAILNNINLDTVAGKVLGLIGPNGSGKSTLIKGITRVINVFSGHIFIEGQEIKSIKREELARLIATVPQNPVLPEAFTAFEVTQFLAERRVGELSGGERQRLIIARALTQQPKALLLDEPTAHLDISHQVEILDMVKSLCLEQSLTVIAALHDLNLAAQYCDWLVMLNGGRIYTEGTPQDVLTVQNIKKVYGAEVCVYPHPLNSLPTTLITASRDKKGRTYIHQ